MTSGNTDIDRASGLMETGNGKIHFVGICGVGMSGLALLMKSRGFDVDGCDGSDSPMREWLENRGIPVHVGHDPGHAAGDGKSEAERLFSLGPD